MTKLPSLIKTSVSVIDSTTINASFDNPDLNASVAGLDEETVKWAIENNIPVYAVKENSTVLDVTKENLYPDSNVIEIETYKEVLSKI